MSRSTRRALATTAAAGCLALLVLVPSACASPALAPNPPHNVITVPGPDQISSTLDASRCAWLVACITALTGGISTVGN